MIKKCPYCGNRYSGYSFNVTCGREECQLERRRIMNRLWDRRNRRKRKRKTRLNRLELDVSEATKCGESYGYYKAVISPEARAYWNKFDQHVKERIKEYEAARTKNRPAASSYERDTGEV